MSPPRNSHSPRGDPPSTPPRNFRWPESSRPIPVEGGVRARSKRGAIGEQWWSRRFIAVLESWGMSGRLQRGRNYARRGQVIEFELTQGRSPPGSRARGPSRTRSASACCRSPLRSGAPSSRLASQALFRAKLLAGEMPAEIEEVFAECGTPLFPRSPADLDMRCSCPDWEVPCKHLAAVCYVLAEAFDDDPFQMLAWRGKARDELLGALRQGTPRQTASATGSPATAGHAADAGAVLADVPGAPLARSLADFWSPGLSQARLRALATAAPATVVPDLLLRMSDPPDITVRGRDLRDLLSPAYEQLADDAS